MANPTISHNNPAYQLLGDNVFAQETFNAAGAATFVAGTILGRLTASGKLTDYDSGAVDGSEVPVAVLTNELVTTGAGDTVLRAMIGGKIRTSALFVHNGGTPIAPTTLEIDALRNYGIVALSDRELLKLDNS